MEGDDIVRHDDATVAPWVYWSWSNQYSTILKLEITRRNNHDLSLLIFEKLQFAIFANITLT